MKLGELQEQFFKTILGTHNTFEDCVIEQGNINKTQRISIYKNAYSSRLKETIETDHELLGLYLGDDLFNQMVDGYIKSHPSQYRSLRFYSEQLPDFLTANQPFNDYPVIAELARFERFLLYSFDAAEAARATLQDLQAVNPNDWPTLCFLLHPSTQLFITTTNCVECWQALKIQQAPPDASQRNAYWLIWRNEEQLTEFLSLSNIELIFIENILQGNNFSIICDQLSQHMPEENVSQFAVSALMTWLEKGIISQLKIT